MLGIGCLNFISLCQSVENSRSSSPKISFPLYVYFSFCVVLNKGRRVELLKTVFLYRCELKLSDQNVWTGGRGDHRKPSALSCCEGRDPHQRGAGQEWTVQQDHSALLMNLQPLLLPKSRSSLNVLAAYFFFSSWSLVWRPKWRLVKVPFYSSYFKISDDAELLF